MTLAKFGFFAAVLAIGTGCAAFGGYPSGSVYNGTTTPHGMTKLEAAGQAKTGDKVGESCATGILMLAAFGDASMDAAKKAGGITDVHSVEFKSFSVLGIYTQGCTEVHGK
ncbi:MAG: TRL-like family protein [Polyangiaceae bacterium]